MRLRFTTPLSCRRSATLQRDTGKENDEKMTSITSVAKTCQALVVVAWSQLIHTVTTKGHADSASIIYCTYQVKRPLGADCAYITWQSSGNS
ncbi:hypothetical protein Tcan_03645 [Toxocara canis]|uniref:Uncharacterized protein n=1 Tax=Toxocara canis TaxID=6265 RepID=A0A0B2VHY5_TOXCA|nr:hypothetical protein Tcan_03645 [Toxocara canis]